MAPCPQVFDKNLQKCNSMYGYMPSYQQLIKPTETITLFDQLASDFEGIKLDKTHSPEQLGHRRIRYGVCLVRNNTFSRDYMKQRLLHYFAL